jgi:hypothetical protein
MPTILWFLTIAALVLAYLLVRHTVVAFRGVLIASAVLGACAGESWAFHRYGFCRMPNIIYLFIPAGVILACVLVYLACTSLRSFLLVGSIVAALAATGWVFSRLTPFAGLLMILWLILRGLSGSTVGGSLSKAFVVHSAVPDISVGEAYMASEADLI